MFSRAEKKQLNTLFFQRFTRHMSSHKSVGGGGNRWEAYRTGVKGVYFRMLTLPNVGLAIDIQHRDEEIRRLIFDQFVELGRLLAAEWGEEATFEKNTSYDSGEAISRISIHLENVSFFDQNHWPEIMNWYEEKLLGLDRFWETVGDIVKELAR